MSLKAKVEAIIYAAEEPITLEQISQLLKDVVLADLAAAKENAALEQADSDAEALTPYAVEAPNSTSEESALLPELAPDSEELVSPETGPPETGPLMPQAAEESAVPADAAPPESVEEKNASDGALEPNDQAREATDSACVEQAEPVATSASVGAPETSLRKRQPKKSEQEIAEDKAVRARVREVLIELVTDYADEERGIEIRQVAGGFRMATKPEHHDVVRAFAKSLKPPIRLSLAALETLAVIAYKQPITGPEISDIRGVESAGVLGTLLDRKLITTAGRKQVIGRPMQYKTSKDFLLRFGLNDVNELPSMEEFSQLASDGTIEIASPEQTPSLFEPSTEVAKPASEKVEMEYPEAHEHGAPLPEVQEIAEPQQPHASEASESQPQSDADSTTAPEAEHPIGQ